MPITAREQLTIIRERLASLRHRELELLGDIILTPKGREVVSLIDAWNGILDFMNVGPFPVEMLTQLNRQVDHLSGSLSNMPLPQDECEQLESALLGVSRRILATYVNQLQTGNGNG